MPPKGKTRKGKRGVKEPPPKEYVLITSADLREIEAKYFARLADVRVALRLYNEAAQDVDNWKLARAEIRKWNEYVAAEGLPKPYLPPQIRMFFEKLRHFEAENIRKTVDWQLAINERSALSQNIFQKDLTRKNLIKSAPNFGAEYNNNIELSLKVLESIGYYLNNGKAVKQCKPRILQDINELKIVIQQDIMKFIDRYTYRVLSSENAYMETIDSITADYSYGGNSFEIHLWTLKHVPILFNPADYPSMIADLHYIKVKLQVPFSVLKEDLTIRAVHYQFDHFSEHCKSFHNDVFLPTGDSTVAPTDLESGLKNEWALLNDLRTEVRNKLILKRIEYEQKMKQLEEEAARKAKERGEKVPKKDDKEGKGKKGRQEPQILTDNLHPDVWEDFIEKENKLFENFLNDAYQPNSEHLTDHEINLNRDMIMGGIYQVYIVTKPNHIDFDSFNMTWHANNGNLFIDKNIKANLKARLSSVSSKRLTNVPSGLAARDVRHQSSSAAAFAALSAAESKHRTTSARDSPEEKSERYTKDAETSPCFVITFNLPHYLCFWSGEPQPCHFEADVVGFIEVIKETIPSTPEPTSTVDVASTASRTDATSITSAATSINQPTPLTTNIETESNILETGMTKPGVGFQSDEDNSNDFNLNLPMTKSQIRLLQRHCLPRIISSFKFPAEILEETTEESRNKPKGQGGTLVRKRVSDPDGAFEVKTNERSYDLQKQRNPERIFPIFPKPEPLRVPYKMGDLLERITTFEPETFLQLVNVFDNIKLFYRTNFSKILDVPVISSKFREERIRQQKALQEPQLGQPSYATIHESKSAKSVRLTTTSERRKSKSAHRFSETADYRPEEKKPEDKAPEENTPEGKTSEEKKPEGKAPEDKKFEIRAPEEKKTDQESDQVEMKPYVFSHWTKKHILHTSYDKEKCTVTVWTDRLGTFGFAFKRYEHLPFRNWSLEPSEENPETEVVLRIDTQFVRCFIYITAAGYRCYVTDFATKYVRNPVVYLEIKKPQISIHNFEKAFHEKHLNIFTKPDARFYIENGYFSEKHAATEQHTYTVMALHCLSMKFRSSDWNRLAARRDLILCLAQAKDTDENLNTLRITPENATFVDVSERCSDNLEDIILDYTLTWRNYEFCADLHHIITSTYPLEERVKDSNLICHVKNILKHLRPLSYS